MSWLHRILWSERVYSIGRFASSYACFSIALTSQACMRTMSLLTKCRVSLVTCAYFGVVEPQKRKTLHIHMLVQLLGFMNPEDILNDNALPDIFRRIWYCVASICFRRTEAFADYLRHPQAVQTLQEEPLLPLTNKQRGMIGEARVQASIKAQLHGRSLSVLLAVRALGRKMSYFPSSEHPDSAVDAGRWCSGVISQVALATRTWIAT